MWWACYDTVLLLWIMYYLTTIAGGIIPSCSPLSSFHSPAAIVLIYGHNSYRPGEFLYFILRNCSQKYICSGRYSYFRKAMFSGKITEQLFAFHKIVLTERKIVHKSIRKSCLMVKTEKVERHALTYFCNRFKFKPWLNHRLHKYVQRFATKKKKIMCTASVFEKIKIDCIVNSVYRVWNITIDSK